MNVSARLNNIPFALRTLIVLVVLTMALSWMVGKRLSILKNGYEVVLKTEPVDPRDLFRGHYARLNYSISTIRGIKPAGGGRLKKHDRVYVALKPGDNGYWNAVAINQDMPKSKPGMAVIRGEVRWNGDRMINLRYGIERYFAPKAEALRLERLGREKVPIGVIVRLSSDGEAAISGLMINGKKIYDEPLF